MQTCSRKDFEIKYRVAIHSIVYNSFNVSKMGSLNQLHDTDLPSIFTFSSLQGNSFKNDNKSIKEDDMYFISISTSNRFAIIAIMSYLGKIKPKNLNLGPCTFSILKVSVYSSCLKSDSKIKTLLVLKDKHSKFILPGDSINKFNMYFNLEKYSNSIKTSMKKKSKRLEFDINEEIIDKLEITPLYKTKNNDELAINTIPILLHNQKLFYVTGTNIDIKIQKDLKDQDLIQLTKLFDSGIGNLTGYGFGYVKEAQTNA